MRQAGEIVYPVINDADLVIRVDAGKLDAFIGEYLVEWQDRPDEKGQDHKNSNYYYCKDCCTVSGYLHSVILGLR